MEGEAHYIYRRITTEDAVGPKVTNVLDKIQN
jgi:hypothetical protein